MVSASYVGVYILMLLPGANASELPVAMNMWAVHALQETRAEKYYDPELADIKKALADLPYNTFRSVKTEKASLPIGDATRMVIDDIYTMVATPVEREPDKRVKMEITIEVKPSSPDKTPVKALETRLSMQEKQLVKLRGLKREPGEMVVVVAID